LLLLALIVFRRFRHLLVRWVPAWTSSSSRLAQPKDR